MMCTIVCTTVLCDYTDLSCINIFTQDKADLQIYKIDIDLEIRASEQKHVNKITKTIQWLKYFVSTKNTSGRDITYFDRESFFYWNGERNM